MAVDHSGVSPLNREPPGVSWLRQPTSPFDVRIVHAARGVVVAVPTGRLDCDAVSRFRCAVAAEIDAGAATIVFDLSETSFIDATGLGVIVSAARSLGTDAVVLVVPHRGLRRTFLVCGLDRVLHVCETRDEALRDLPVAEPVAAPVAEPVAVSAKHHDHQPTAVADTEPRSGRGRGESFGTTKPRRLTKRTRCSP